MIRLMCIAAAVAMLASPVSAQKLDAKGKCHGPDGKFAKMEVCKPASSATPTHCRDKATKKFAKCSAPNTEAVPGKK